MRPLALLAATFMAIPAAAIDAKKASEKAGLSAEGIVEVAEPKAVEVGFGAGAGAQQSAGSAWTLAEARRLRAGAKEFPTESIMGDWTAIGVVQEPADPSQAATGVQNENGVSLPSSMLPRRLEFLRDYKDANYLVLSADGREAAGCGTIAELPRMRQAVCEEGRFPAATANIDCRMPADGTLVCEIVTRTVGTYIASLGDRARTRYFVKYARPAAARR